jgi:hypothetical protein
VTLIIPTAGALAGTTIATTATATVTKAEIAMTTLQKTLITTIITAAVGTAVYQTIQNSKLRGENGSQQQQNESQQHQIAQQILESESLSNRLPVVADAKSLPDEQFKELLRLRGQVGVLRSQKTELESSLANVRNSQPRGPNPVTGQQPPPALPADYPKTADGATKDMFESFAGGDWDAFFAKFDMDGGRELFEKSITEGAKKTMVGMEVVSIGTPTNSFGPNMWFVPYTLRFKNGGEKTKLLHVAQDPRTQRWILKGGSRSSASHHRCHNSSLRFMTFALTWDAFAATSPASLPLADFPGNPEIAPGFRDSAGGDFSLPAKSDAAKAGFSLSGTGFLAQGAGGLASGPAGVAVPRC